MTVMANRYDIERTFTSTSGRVLRVSVSNVSSTVASSVVDEDDQAWFWTSAWQEAEAEADQNLRDGDYDEFDSLDDFIATL